jgi:16S rRNA (adenine1518-N6/adenine1519-N6)-dimethyltransferase
VELIDIVKRGSFVPPPKVDSGIITIQNIKSVFKDSVEDKEFFTLIKSAFQYKRKLFIKYIPEKYKTYFIENSLDKERAEDLILEDWIESICHHR